MIKEIIKTEIIKENSYTLSFQCAIYNTNIELDIYNIKKYSHNKKTQISSEFFYNLQVKMLINGVKTLVNTGLKKGLDDLVKRFRRFIKKV